MPLRRSISPRATPDTTAMPTAATTTTTATANATVTSPSRSRGRGRGRLPSRSRSPLAATSATSAETRAPAGRTRAHDTLRRRAAPTPALDDARIKKENAEMRRRISQAKARVVCRSPARATTTTTHVNANANMAAGDATTARVPHPDPVAAADAAPVPTRLHASERERERERVAMIPATNLNTPTRSLRVRDRVQPTEAATNGPRGSQHGTQPSIRPQELMSVRASTSDKSNGNNISNDAPPVHETQETQETHETLESQEIQETQNNQATHEGQETDEVQENHETHENQETNETQENQETHESLLAPGEEQVLNVRMTAAAYTALVDAYSSDSPQSATLVETRAKVSVQDLIRRWEPERQSMTRQSPTQLSASSHRLIGPLSAARFAVYSNRPKLGMPTVNEEDPDGLPALMATSSSEGEVEDIHGGGEDTGGVEIEQTNQADGGVAHDREGTKHDAVFDNNLEIKGRAEEEREEEITIGPYTTVETPAQGQPETQPQTHPLTQAAEAEPEPEAIASGKDSSQRRRRHKRVVAARYMNYEIDQQSSYWRRRRLAEAIRHTVAAST